jgi:hypothetical protein
LLIVRIAGYKITAIAAALRFLLLNYERCVARMHIALSQIDFDIQARSGVCNFTP